MSKINFPTIHIAGIEEPFIYSEKEPLNSFLSNVLYKAKEVVSEETGIKVTINIDEKDVNFSLKSGFQPANHSQVAISSLNDLLSEDKISSTLKETTFVGWYLQKSLDKVDDFTEINWTKRGGLNKAVRESKNLFQFTKIILLDLQDRKAGVRLDIAVSKNIAAKHQIGVLAKTLGKQITTLNKETAKLLITNTVTLLNAASKLQKRKPEVGAEITK